MAHKYLTRAETGKIARKLLKEAFPGHKFSVRTKDGSMRVVWTDGVTESEVRDVLDIFKGKSFDGMIDMAVYRYMWLLTDGTYTYGRSQGTTGSGGFIPESAPERPEGAIEVSSGVDYIFYERNYSADILRSHAEYIINLRGFNTYPDFPPIEIKEWDSGRAYIDMPIYKVPNSQETANISQMVWKRLKDISFYEAPAATNGKGSKPATHETTDETDGTAHDGTQFHASQSGSWVWVKFDGKPDPSVLEAIKTLGGRWSRKRSSWFVKNGAIADVAANLAI